MSTLGTDPATGLQVVIATVAICLTLLLLVRIGGQRSLAAMSGADVACVVALGAVVGRTAMLAVPTLATGMIALGTLFLLQRVLTSDIRVPLVRRLLAREPVVLVEQGRILTEQMRRARVSEDDLRQRLRSIGLSRLSDVSIAVLERNGQISVLRAESHLDQWIAADLPSR